MRQSPPQPQGIARRSVVALCGFGLLDATIAHAGTPVPASHAAATVTAPDRTIGDWLERMHDASRTRSFVGTLVMSSDTGAMSSARIWHACDGRQQFDRVESLTGAPRSTFRRNDEVVTFIPESHIARRERRESLGAFPDLLKSGQTSIPQFYSARLVGADRVAGFDADVVQLVPKDTLRFGYRIWSEKRSGLIMKLQTLDAADKVLEQAAFSELNLDAPVHARKLKQMMTATAGWHVEQAKAVPTTAAAEGWRLKSDIPGFRAVSCYRRPAGSAPVPAGGVQWLFSDGLAAVSLFIERFDPKRHLHEAVFSTGATQTMTHRLQDWWLSAVGEVPPQTLKLFAENLERTN